MQTISMVRAPPEPRLHRFSFAQVGLVSSLQLSWSVGLIGFRQNDDRAQAAGRGILKTNLAAVDTR